MDSLASIIAGILTNEYTTADKIGRSTVGEYVIDTCYTNDCGYETAIWRNDNEMVIVERYCDKETAADGHKKWCSFCESKPTKVYSIQLGEVLEL